MLLPRCVVVSAFLALCAMPHAVGTPVEVQTRSGHLRVTRVSGTTCGRPRLAAVSWAEAVAWRMYEPSAEALGMLRAIADQLDAVGRCACGDVVGGNERDAVTFAKLEAAGLVESDYATDTGSSVQLTSYGAAYVGRHVAPEVSP